MPMPPSTRPSSQRWLDAGLVIFGKTNTPEFGAKGITESELLGPARNPWNLARTPGGSSGGAAAAVAAGIVPVAGASDGGGSIRIPAACCGLFGLKPGRGADPHRPARGEGLHGAATDGVVSRTVRDSAAMLDVLAGPDPEAPTSPAPPDGRSPTRSARPGPAADRLLHDPRDQARARTPRRSPPPRRPRSCWSSWATTVEQRRRRRTTTPRSPRTSCTTWFVHVADIVDEIKPLTGAGDDGFELDTLLMAALGRGPERRRALRRARAPPARTYAALADFHERYDLLLTPTLARRRRGSASSTRRAAARPRSRALLQDAHRRRAAPTRHRRPA